MGNVTELWHTVPVKTGATAPESPAKCGPFTVFAWLWAAGIISHMASSLGASRAGDGRHVRRSRSLSCSASTGCRAFFTLLAVHVIYVYIRLPRVPNHSVIAAAVDLTILGAALWAAISTRNWRHRYTALYKMFAPVVRIELLIVYFFVVFHKLNSGFFDPRA